ncbi:hypothetical protein [Acinetobacter sp. YH01020]|uniref:hypothetical protein n=1 Tax=Acinetobacter sp. YH01020 TaxID=2601034 RepID=UPI0015D3BF20|nr:hypothetical protein [Acinetobacter sp. YH01020]
MLIPFPFRFFLLNCLILFSCFISPNIYAEINSAVLEELKNSNVVDQTNSLSRDKIAQLKKQNEQLYQQKHVDLALLHKPICKGFFSDIIFK